MKHLKLFEEVDRGKEIVYTLKTKAISLGDKKNYEYNVNIIQGERKFPDEYDSLILSIQETPGAWYVSTLMDGDSFYRDKAVIDGGLRWYVDNWADISKEFLEILPELKAKIKN